MTITAAMVKELREVSGAGMMDCKTALNETGGEMEAAIDWLRTKGLSKAAKKAGRVASEGLIAISGDDKKMAMIEVNSETDFVARNEKFQELVMNIAAVAQSTGNDVEKILAADYPNAGKSVADTITDAVTTIGENMNLRRAINLSVGNGFVARYIHNKVAPDRGKIGVLVAVESEGNIEKLKEVGHSVAMHIAAANPLALNENDVDAALLNREKEIFIQQARDSGKPDNIIEKMVEGRMRKYLQEIVLLKQTFVIDADKTVEQAVAAAESEAGAPIKITGFYRYELGEGIERKESDFAAEVAAAAGQA